MSFKNELTQLITLELFNKFSEEALDVLRHFFKFYASNEEYLIEGLKFFSLFPNIIKIQKFNSVKAFLFYFAYQKKNYFMASYLYSVAVSMGVRNNYEDCKIFNNFSLQMLRSLCFLKSLTDFDIKNFLSKEGNRMMHSENELLLIKYEDINVYFNYILKEKNELESLTTLIKSNKDLLKDHKLKGLKNEAEEALIYKKIKDTLYLYKKIKMGKLSQKCQVEFNDLMKVIKKKVMSGELNIKYDEVTDEIEVFDVDPGLKERVQKTKELYNKIIEANKNLFITLRDRKIDEMSGDKYSKEEREFINMRQLEEHFEEDYVEMDMDDD